MKYVAIIPARYASTRFPAKPLALLDGKPIIQWVCQQVQTCFDTTYVATDDERIARCVSDFGGRPIMTSSHHRSGTDRIREALDSLSTPHDVVVNVQGDEPFVDRQQLELLKSCFDNDPATQIATLVKPFDSGCSWEALSNPNSPKVVIDDCHRALYFSRTVIPYVRGAEPAAWSQKHTYYKHLGLYAYRVDVLRAITELPPSPLEQAESLEQLRWLQAGYTIKVGITHIETVGIDTPADLQRAEALLRQRQSEPPRP